MVDSYSHNSGSSKNFGGGNDGGSANRGSSISYAQQSRELLRPEEILTLGDDYLIAFHHGLPTPVIARRIKWYADKAFNPSAKEHRRPRKLPVLRFVIWILLIAIVCLAIRAKVNGYGYWSPNFQWR